MSRIPDELLVHLVDVARRQDVGGSVRAVFDPVEEDLPAITVDKRRLVIDQRQDSDTSGQQIMASTHVLVQPEAFIPPGSKITVWKGTPMQRDGIVVSTAYADHPIAPSSAQAWVQ